MEPPPDYTLFQEVHYDKDGLETACFNVDGKTYSYYDNKQRLVREQSFNEERVIVKEYEYAPDGEIYHTHEASYTLACITGGIAEAYYKEIPKWIADKVMLPFPKIFYMILEEVRNKTEYGKLCRIVD